MPSKIRKVAVIGAGMMGGQLAAQVANAGIPVLLLDIVPKDASDRNILAKKAIERMSGPDTPLMHPQIVEKIEPCNIDDDLVRIKECDLVLESVPDNPKIKSDLLRKIDAYRNPGTVVASNTSSIPMAELLGNQSPALRKDFMMTHFFDPVRYMRPLELVAGPSTDPKTVQFMSSFCDQVLGKGLLPCNDTPGFIANRLGMFWIQSAMNAAFDLGLSVEEADEICCQVFGVPSTGIFGLIDVMGLDVMYTVARNLAQALPSDDHYRSVFQEHELCRTMIAEGCVGLRGKGGFYRTAKAADDLDIRESRDLKSGEYVRIKLLRRAAFETRGADLRVLCESSDQIGQFVWRVLSETLLYAFKLVPATVSSIVLVDEAMKMCFNWKFGPFQILDRLGADWTIRRLKAEQRPVPDLLDKASGKRFYHIGRNQLLFLNVKGDFEPLKRPDGVLLLRDIKVFTRPVEKNLSASLWDIGDGVLCLEFTTKGNHLNREIFDMIVQAVTLIGEGDGPWKGLVLYNDGQDFSSGLDLGSIRTCIKTGDYSSIESLIKAGQKAYTALRFAPFPTVAAPFMGVRDAAAELLFHCAAVQAYCETSIGLAGANVGLTPTFGGCAHLLGQAYADDRSDVPPVNQVFTAITSASISSCALEAKAIGYMRQTDGVTMNKDRLLYDAKMRVLQIVQAKYAPPKPRTYNLPGSSGRAALDLILQTSESSPHKKEFGKVLADILCGVESGSWDALTEQQVMDAECAAFLKLCHLPETLARLEDRLARNVTSEVCASEDNSTKGGE